MSIARTRVVMPSQLLPPLRTCFTYTKYAAGALVAASMTSAWYHRPLTDDEARAKGARLVPPPTRGRDPPLLDLARHLAIGATTVAIRLLMSSYGAYEIRDDAAYRRFVRSVAGGAGRRPGQGLLTVSNHRSLFDDPGVVSCLLPLRLAVQPRYNRWGLCSQEYCFNEALPGLVKGYIGAGQVLPIRRGGGIDQRALLDFGRHLAHGEWCHVFPEGGVWQWDELGGRRASGVGGTDEQGSDPILPGTLRQKALPPAPSGKLRWGVGKLIAHAPVPPRVIPFAHHGMERLLPQEPHTGRTSLTPTPLAGLLWGDSADRLRVRVHFGEEIAFDDLVEEHEARHGTLWKYGGGGEERWASSTEERALYSKIVHRIESRLEAVTRDVCQQEGSERQGG